MSVSDNVRSAKNQGAERIGATADSMAGKAEAAVRDSTDKAVARVGDVSNRFLDSLGNAVDAGADQLREDGFGRTAEVFKGVSSYLREFASDVDRRADEGFGDRVVSGIRNNPLLAGVALAGTGYLLASLMRARSHESSAHVRGGFDQSDHDDYGGYGGGYADDDELGAERRGYGAGNDYGAHSTRGRPDTFADSGSHSTMPSATPQGEAGTGATRSSTSGSGTTSAANTGRTSGQAQEHGSGSAARSPDRDLGNQSAQQPKSGNGSSGLGGTGGLR